jgi:hypothetical protein
MKLMTVRQFHTQLTKLKKGEQVVVVDGSRHTIVGAFDVVDAPAQVERTIHIVYRRQNAA